MFVPKCFPEDSLDRDHRLTFERYTVPSERLPLLEKCFSVGVQGEWNLMFEELSTRHAADGWLVYNVGRVLLRRWNGDDGDSRRLRRDRRDPEYVIMQAEALGSCNKRFDDWTRSPIF